jgi:hypothetical protein
MKLVLGLLIGVGAGVLIGPALAAKLQWPVWVTFIIVALDGLLIVDVPYQFSEFFASTHLHQRGYGQFADGCGITFLLFVLFGLAPVVVLFWLVWQFLV